MGLRTRLIAALVSMLVLAFALLLIGVNFGLRSDVQGLATKSVTAGSSALASAVASRAEQTRTIILQGAAEASLAQALKAHDVTTLRGAVSDLALQGALSFVVVTDAKGTVLAGSRPASGSLAKDGIVASALAGSLIGGTTLLDAATLRALGVSSTGPALAIVTGSPVNVNGATVGVLYGGTLLDANSKFVDDVAQVTGGQAGIALNGALVATSLSTKDGAKETGTVIPDAAIVANRTTYTGLQKIDGVDYSC